MNSRKPSSIGAGDLVCSMRGRSETSAMEDPATSVLGRGKKSRFEPTDEEVSFVPAHIRTRPKQRGTYQCRACEVEFFSPAVFEEHRWGPHGRRGCLTVSFLVRQGFRQDEKGVLHGPPMSEDQLARFARKPSAP